MRPGRALERKQAGVSLPLDPPSCCPLLHLPPSLHPSVCAARSIWDQYFPKVDAIVYLVDSQDRERFPEAKTELDNLMRHDGLAQVPFLILGNKIDAPGAASEPELKAVLGLMETTGKATKVAKDSGVRPVEVFMCSVTKKLGYGDGFKWLTDQL